MSGSSARVAPAGVSPGAVSRRAGQEAGLAALISVLAFLVYLATIAPTVGTNDAGRFQIAAPLLGTGHPTGYPTFIILGKLFTFLPLGDIAFRVNLMSAVFGGLGAGLSYLVGRRLGAGRAASAGAVLLFAFTATFWSQATVAEVYSMHVFFVVAATLLLLRWRESESVRPLVLCGFVCGVALGNNAGIALFAPMFFVLLFTGRVRPSLWKFVCGAGAFLVGLSVYAYVPVRGFSGAWHNYGDEVSSWQDMWNLVSGARFQGLMNPSPKTISGNFGGFVSDFASQAPAPFGYGLAALLFLGGVAGLIVVFRRSPAAAVALALGLAATLLYALSYEIDDISVYYIPVYLLLALLSAAAFPAFPAKLGAIQAVPIIVAALVLGLNYADSDRSGEYSERERSEEILALLPEDAVLYGKIEILPVTYLREVEGERTDITLRWLDGGTLDRNFPSDVESGRPVYFISDESYDDEYLPSTEEYATSEKEGPLIAFSPR